MLKKDIISEIKNKNLPVIIYGAGVVGEFLLSVCEKNGISVDCFADSSEKVAEDNFCGKEVIFGPDLKKKYKEAIFIISVVAIKDVVDLLHEMGFNNWYAGGLLLKDLDIFQRDPDAIIDYPKYAIETCILCHEGYLNKDKLFLRSVDIIITERCSLKCQGCSNLMQYYEKPQNCNMNTLEKSINAFCAVFDEVMDFRVIGGEPFMNMEWPIIVKKLTDNKKAKRVVIYTNGTIIPKEEHIPYLKNNKVVVVISDYGPLSRNMTGLKQMLEKNKITHYVNKITEWLDCSAIVPHNRTDEENREIFKKCCAKNMATLSDGKFFRCPYAANAVRLSAVPNNKNDYVDLFEEPLDEKGTLITKNKIRNYLSNNDYLKICDFCNGRPLSGPAIMPNIQTEKPLPYHKYN